MYMGRLMITFGDLVGPPSSHPPVSPLADFGSLVIIHAECPGARKGLSASHSVLRFLDATDATRLRKVTSLRLLAFTEDLTAPA